MDAINDIGDIREVELLTRLTVYCVTVFLHEMIIMFLWESSQGSARIWSDMTLASLLIAVACRFSTYQDIV